MFFYQYLIKSLFIYLSSEKSIIEILTHVDFRRPVISPVLFLIFIFISDGYYRSLFSFNSVYLPEHIH